jgi:hypothetical protein
MKFYADDFAENGITKISQISSLIIQTDENKNATLFDQI